MIAIQVIQVVAYGTTSCPLLDEGAPTLFSLGYLVDSARDASNENFGFRDSIPCIGNRLEDF